MQYCFYRIPNSDYIPGSTFINQIYHVTYIPEDLERYTNAHHAEPLEFNLKYHTYDLQQRLFPRGHEESLSTPLLASHPSHSLYTGFVKGRLLQAVEWFIVTSVH